MVEAKFFYKSNLLKKVVIEGHAGYDKKGSDIVCASVSILSRTVLRFLVSDRLIDKKNVQIEENLLTFELDYDGFDEKAKIKAETLASLLSLGLQDLSKEYPANIKLTIGEI